MNADTVYGCVKVDIVGGFRVKTCCFDRQCVSRGNVWVCRGKPCKVFLVDRQCECLVTHGCVEETLCVVCCSRQTDIDNAGVRCTVMLL